MSIEELRDKAIAAIIATESLDPFDSDSVMHSYALFDVASESVTAYGMARFQLPLGNEGSEHPEYIYHGCEYKTLWARYLKSYEEFKRLRNLSFKIDNLDFEPDADSELAPIAPVVQPETKKVASRPALPGVRLFQVLDKFRSLGTYQVTASTAPQVSTG